MIIGSESDHGRFKWIGSELAVMNAGPPGIPVSRLQNSPREVRIFPKVSVIEKPLSIIKAATLYSINYVADLQ